MLALACSDGGITTSDGELRFAEERLEFPRTFVGHPTEAEVVIENTGRGAVAVRVLVDAPFAVALPDANLPPGEHAIRVRFDPAAPGHFESRFVVDLRGEQMALVVSGLAEAVPDCTTGEACRVRTFDSALGVCVDAFAADGTSCVSACLEASFCRSGECIGAPKRCDDGNACTADACDPELGCVNADNSSACAVPSDPCRAAFCNPATGCGEETVPDGTSCGDSDCVSMRVCLAGQCQVVATPEGSACGEETPCQSQGRCRSGTCDFPAPTVMQPVWSYEPADRVVTLTGSVDESGSLYAYSGNSSSGDVRLVSFTVGGIERWSQPIERGGFPELQGYGRLFATNRSVVLNAQALDVRRAIDGTRAWAADPAIDESLLDAAPSTDGRFVGVMRRVSAAGDEWLVLAEVEASTGTVLPAHDEIRSPELGVTGRDGRHVLRHHSPVAGFQVSAVDPGVRLAWTKPSVFWPAATVRDLVFGFDDAGAVALHTTNGNEAYRLPLAPPDWKQERRFVADDENGFALSAACDGSDCTWGMSRPQKLVGFSPADGAIRFESTLPGSAYGPLQLTSRGTALVLEAGDRLRVSEYGVTGDLKFQCAADIPFREADTAAFIDGLLVVGGPRSPRIRAYAMPNLSPATSGWVSERGSVARDSRPLP